MTQERKMVKQVIDSSLHYQLEGSIASAIQELQRMAETYPNVYIDWFEDYDGTKQLHLCQQVPESDSQMADRITREERQAVLTAEFERKQYEALKKKFGE
jgi:hypothetical protein